MTSPYPIKIDLRDLTQAHLDEAVPHMGKCSYASPCIIGSLIPVEHREAFDNRNRELKEHGILSQPTVGILAHAKLIEFADPEQQDAAAELQEYFDNDREDNLVGAAQIWINATKEQTPC